ncbi:MAG TPA: DUF2017 family protein [Jatrophihabitans sp.]|nr:DUF2017 family protein [Jatrophihabitans sp.]
MVRKAALLRVDLAEAESSLLAGLFDDFATMLAAPDLADPVYQRLFPDGYTEDEVASAEYRDMVETDLQAGRAGRLQSCRAELPDGDGRISLDREAADRWLRVLNDLRLALGVRLEITEDSELNPAEPAVAIYHWLSAVQELLVETLMG